MDCTWDEEQSATVFKGPANLYALRCGGDGILYGVDRFVPIGLGVEEELEPRQWWSEMYDHVHVIAGWLLIPLFLASWSGLVRSP